jgi:hypothetical protein
MILFTHLSRHRDTVWVGMPGTPENQSERIAPNALNLRSISVEDDIT